MFNTHRMCGAVVFLLALSVAGGRAQAQLPKAVLQAMSDVSRGGASAGQEALLMAYNRQINQHHLRGWFTDEMYQAAQKVYAKKNAELAEAAAKSVDAKFGPQVAISDRFSPGTDSDYITTINSKDPVGDVKRMQRRYNRNVNEYLTEAINSDPKVKAALAAENIPFKARPDWHVHLDVDFMVNPMVDGKFVVSKQQFEEIAKLNNDAYKRRQAAVYEALSRTDTPTRITPDLYRGYAEEMKDFIRKKQKILAEYRKKPALLRDPAHLVEYQRLMAQEQKYISRIESANARLRVQERLGHATHASSSYQTGFDKDGNMLIRTKTDETLASRAAKRSRKNLMTTTHGSALAVHSQNRAIAELSESMAEAARKNPKFWGSAADDIAALTEHFSPEEKGRLIERIRQSSGADAASDLAKSFRQQARQAGASPSVLSKLDEAFKSARRTAANLLDMKRLGRSISQGAKKALENLRKGPGGLGVALEGAVAISNGKAFLDNLAKAMNPKITDAEADEYLRKAELARNQMIKDASLGAVLEAFPALGAIYFSWTIGHDGTNYVLNNTKTGQQFNRAAADYFDRHGRALGRAQDDLAEHLPGVFGNVFDESDRLNEEERLRELEARYWAAIRRGEILLQPGVRTTQIAELIRDGDFVSLRESIHYVDPNDPSVVLQTLQNDVAQLQGLQSQLKSLLAEASNEAQRAEAFKKQAQTALQKLEKAKSLATTAAVNCSLGEAFRARIQEDAQGAKRLQELVDDVCDSADRQAADIRSMDHKSRLLTAYAKAKEYAVKAGAAAANAKQLNGKLQAVIKESAAAGRARTAAVGAADAVAGHVSSCQLAAVRAQGAAERARETAATLSQRRLALIGQISRMQSVFAGKPRVEQWLTGFEQAAQAIDPAAGVQALLARVETTRATVDPLPARARALTGELTASALCHSQDAEVESVKAAETAAFLAALRVARSDANRKQVVHWTKHSEPPINLADLASGVRRRTLEPTKEQPKPRVAPTKTTRPKRSEPLVRKQPRKQLPQEDRSPRSQPSGSRKKPIYAVYAVYAYPRAPTGDLAALQRWKQQNLNPRSFQPSSRPSGYVAFHVTGEVLQDYEQHAAKVQSGQTRRRYYLFRPDAKYHQTMTTVGDQGERITAPLLLSFKRLEYAEPTWVRRTRVGVMAEMQGDIHALSTKRALGGWTGSMLGRRASVGPIQYDGEASWSGQTRAEAAAFLKVIVLSIESIFR